MDELKQKIRISASDINFNLQKSDSYTLLSDDAKYDSTVTQTKNKVIHSRSLSNNAIPSKKSSSFTLDKNKVLAKEHQSRRPESTNSIGTGSLQSQSYFKIGDQQETCENMKTSNTSKLFGGLGSVKSLVQSYEENSSKDNNPFNFKIEKIKNERLKEVHSCVNIPKVDEQREKALAEMQRYEDELYNDKGYEQLLELHSRQFDSNCKKQYQIQKELSTISERTEHSVSFNNCLQPNGLPSSNNNTVTTGGSPVNTVANSNSKATTVTKSIRHLNQQHFLDVSTGASGDGVSVNKNISVLNSSTPILLNNLTTASSNLSAINSIKSSDKKHDWLAETS